MIVSDRLRVAGETLAGEDLRARGIERVVTDGRPVAARLAERGVGWVLVYRDQPGAADLPLAGLRRVTGGRDVVLYAVPGQARPPDGVSAVARVVVMGVDGMLLLLVVVSGVLVVPRRRSGARPDSLIRSDHLRRET